MADHDHRGRHRHGRHDHPGKAEQAGHAHGVMSGAIVRPYDLLVGGLLMRRTYASIVELLTTTVPTEGTVVDIGTGPGRVPALLGKRRGDLSVIGVDPSGDMLDRARHRAAGLANVSFVEAGSEQLPLADNSADAVISSLSSHHWADPKAALAEQSRILKFGGRLWLIDLTRHLAADLPPIVARSGLTLLDEPSPFGGLARRRFVVLAALKPG
jgi:ubiquinone/menaquinone biosynthesis C-methylase UbiE